MNAQIIRILILTTSNFQRNDFMKKIIKIFFCREENLIFENYFFKVVYLLA